MAPTTARPHQHKVKFKGKGKGQSIPNPTEFPDHKLPDHHGVSNSDLANFAQIPDAEPREVTQDDINRAEAVRLKTLRSNRRKAGMTAQRVHEVRSKVFGRRNSEDSSSSSASVASIASTTSPANLHTHEYFVDMKKKTDRLWETSGQSPGHPGFGYKADGTPTGSQYILHTRHRGYSSLKNRHQSSPPGAAQDEAVRKELKQGGWHSPENMVQTVAGVSACKHKCLTLRDVRAYNAKREIEELEKIWKKNVELDFE